VKVDVDRAGDVASSFGVRSIPAVFGVRDGQVLDAFAGVQPESAIRQWIDRLLPSPAESLAMQAQGLEATDPGAAEAKYAEALALVPDMPEARIGLARLALAAGRIEEAAGAIAELERRGFLEAEGEKLKAELILRTQAEGSGGVDAARAALAADPKNLDRKFELAEALAASGGYEEALGLCLDLVERDRKGVGEKARQTMLAVFQLLPPDSDLVSEYRRQLSLVL
jgi:putative thioredoxin